MECGSLIVEPDGVGELGAGEEWAWVLDIPSMCDGEVLCKSQRGEVLFSLSLL